MSKKYTLKKINSTISTNLEIKKILLKNKKINNYCLSANKQLKGYGRRNTKWFSYDGNLHLSILIKPNCNLDIVNQLSFMSAVSIGETLTNINKNINIEYKWPNDILLNKKKISGIIIETSSYLNKKIKWVIIGIGLNFNKYPKLKDKYFQATSLSKENFLIEKDFFTEVFLKNFFKNYNLWKSSGFNSIKKKWLNKIYKKKNKIVIRYKNKYLKGRIISLLSNGGLKLETNKKIKEPFFGDQII